MRDISFEFEKGKVLESTQTYFDVINEGKEVIVSGKFVNNNESSIILSQVFPFNINCVTCFRIFK